MKRPETKIKPFILINTKTGKEYPFNKVMDCVTFLRASGHPRAGRASVYDLIRGSSKSYYEYVIEYTQPVDNSIIALPYKERVKYEAHELILRIEMDLKSLKSLLESQ